jgi:hypothetical protein
MAAAPVADVHPGGGEAEALVQARPAAKFRRAYSVNFSDTNVPGRRRPGSFTREAFAVLLQQRHREEFEEVMQEGVPANHVLKIMVFQELHANGQPHLYAVILCDRPYGCASIQRCLQTEDRVCASFGYDHAYFWSGVLYGGVPSVHKAPAELDPAPYHSEGRTLRGELVDMPRGARKADKDRVRAHLGLADPAQATRGGKDIFSKEQLAEHVRAEGLRSRAQVLAAAEATRADSPILYNTVLHMGMKPLGDFMALVWALAGDDGEPAIDRIQKLLATSENAACICGGRWGAAAERLLTMQGIPSAYFRGLVVRALQLGRNKTVNVLVVGAPDSGKSFCFKPLVKIFDAFIRRGQTENFPLQGLHGSEVCVLQDVRYESFGLPWDDWLCWAELEDIMVKLPRSHFEESKRYSGTAPLFATMTDVFQYPLREAQKTNRSVEKENRQFRSRWTIVEFRHEIPVEQRDISLPSCPRCAAEWYAEVVGQDLPAPPPPQMPAAGMAVEDAPSDAAVEQRGPKRQRAPQRGDDAVDALWARLSQLMAWHGDGRLSESEFLNAKRLLGL